MAKEGKRELKKFLIMDRGMVVGSSRLLPGHYEIGSDVSEETARLAITLGKGRDEASRPRKAAAASVDGGANKDLADKPGE